MEHPCSQMGPSSPVQADAACRFRQNDGIRCRLYRIRLFPRIHGLGAFVHFPAVRLYGYVGADTVERSDDESASRRESGQRDRVGVIDFGSADGDSDVRARLVCDQLRTYGLRGDHVLYYYSNGRLRFVFERFLFCGFYAMAKCWTS